jgi:hypothetical protein
MPILRFASCARLAAAAAVLATAAPAARAQGVRIKFAAWQESVLLDTLRQNRDIMADPRKVYAAVLKTYADLGIPTGKTDGKAGIVGSERFERMRVLADAPMSKSFNCGGDGPAGPHANEFRVEIAVVTWVEPGPEGAKIGVATAASARDVSGVFRNPMGCTSTGELEAKIIKRVQTLVAFNK